MDSERQEARVRIGDLVVVQDELVVLDVTRGDLEDPVAALLHRHGADDGLTVRGKRAHGHALRRRREDAERRRAVVRSTGAESAAHAALAGRPVTMRGVVRASAVRPTLWTHARSSLSRDWNTASATGPRSMSASSARARSAAGAYDGFTDSSS